MDLRLLLPLESQKENPDDENPDDAKTKILWIICVDGRLVFFFNLVFGSCLHRGAKFHKIDSQESSDSSKQISKSVQQNLFWRISLMLLMGLLLAFNTFVEVVN